MKSYKDLYNEVGAIVRVYQTRKEKLQTIIEKIKSESGFKYEVRDTWDFSRSELEATKDVITRIEQALNGLDDEFKSIIVNEFFAPKETDWWEPIYSKSTFYRAKKQAMDQFLELLYYRKGV